MTAPTTTGEQQLAEPQPRSLAIAAGGIRTANDFANMMSALMSDLIEGRVSPNVGNATCNAGGKLLRIVELQYRFGKADEKGDRTLQLAVPRGDE